MITAADLAAFIGVDAEDEEARDIYEVARAFVQEWADYHCKRDRIPDPIFNRAVKMVGSDLWESNRAPGGIRQISVAGADSSAMPLRVSNDAQRAVKGLFRPWQRVIFA